MKEIRLLFGVYIAQLLLKLKKVYKILSKLQFNLNAFDKL